MSLQWPNWTEKEWRIKIAEAEGEVLAKALHYRTTFQGLQISIENRKGSVRSGTSPDGTAWSVTMTHPYGYIRMTEGMDSDHVDCFIGPNPDAKKAYVIRAMKAGTFDEYDEDKVMLGFDGVQEAHAAFMENYSDPRFYGGMRVLPMAEFKEKVLATKDDPGMVKAHIKTYTKVSPTGKLETVKEHEDARPSARDHGSHKDEPRTERELNEYRGIHHVTFTPMGNYDKELIKENREIIDRVLDKLPTGAVTGLSALYITGGTFTPLGAAAYTPPSTRRGYASDEIIAQDAWIKKSPTDKEAALLHEFGHRIQLVSHIALFEDFVKQGLGQYASEMLGQYYSTYAKQSKPHLFGEAFAESFARYKMQKQLPEKLAAFWKKTNL